jgi:hypothetical protein
VDAVVIDLTTHANRGPHPDRIDNCVPGDQYIASAVVERSTDSADEVAQRSSALVAPAVIVGGPVRVDALAAQHDALSESVRRTPVAHERCAVLDDVFACAGPDDADHDAEDAFVDARVDPRASPIRPRGKRRASGQAGWEESARTVPATPSRAHRTGTAVVTLSGAMTPGGLPSEAV